MQIRPKVSSGELKQATRSPAAMWILKLYVSFNEDFISCFYTSSNAVFTLALFMLYCLHTSVSRSSAKFIAISSVGKT
jgi:hypothetical protein